ncbi:MAG: hypothetical protein IIU42_03040 [Ruminococcus sp.]|nr:hypothetical protein [Ruminococcus sp.]MBQ1944582.1 hypothetical protein [Ruminococcus sp.]MBQ5381598.1 hypothetical protein [Ruminococcus sp.]
MQKAASVFSVISFVTGLILPVLFLIFFLSGMFNTEDYVSLIVFTVLASCLWTVPGLVLGVLAQKHRTKVKKLSIWGFVLNAVSLAPLAFLLTEIITEKLNALFY